MFGKRIWERIKSLAALFMMLGIWGGVVFLILLFTDIGRGGGIGFIGIGVCLTLIVSSWIIYGFGELIENSAETAQNTKSILLHLIEADQKETETDKEN
jgi:hypothetical protein